MEANTVSAEEVASNGDVLTQILLCLPIKSLFKFKAVSKPWFSLISDPGFRRRRSSSPTSASGLFIRRKEMGMEFKSIALNPTSHLPPFQPSAFGGGGGGGDDDDGDDERPSFNIQHSCNGLLLYTIGRRFKPTLLYVCNPTTNRHALIPSPPSPEDSSIYGLALAFDPSESPHYKVICVVHDDDQGYNDDGRQKRILSFFIYSSESQSWRLTHATLDDEDYLINYDRDIVFWNGSVHWMSPLIDELDGWIMDSRYPTFAPYFHVATEETRRVKTIDSQSCYYGASRDCFHAVNRGELIHSHFTVFELEKDYSEWVAKYRVDISEIRRAFPEIPPELDYEMLVICVVRCEIEE